MVAVRIEYIGSTHWPQIAAIARRAFPVPALAPTSDCRRRWHDTGVRLAAIGDTGVVGFAIGAWHYESSAEPHEMRLRHLSIDMLAVEAHSRRHGIGRRLMSSMIERGSARGARSFCLMVEFENLHAIRLYESLGFQRGPLELDFYGAGLHGYGMTRAARTEDRRDTRGPPICE